MDDQNENEGMPSQELSPEEQAQVDESERLDAERARTGEPRAADFTDYDDYVKSLIDWRVKQASPGSLPAGDPKTVVGHAVAQGVAYALQRDRTEQAEAAAKTTLTPFPDDPHRAKRAELERLSTEFGIEAIKQKEAGNIEKYRDWRQRQLQYENELSKLPPKPEQQYAQAASDHVDFVSVGTLFNKETADDKKWDHPRMQADAGIVISRANSRNPGGVIALPMESSPFGEPLPIHPKNMCQVQLPADQYERFKNMVYRSGGDDSPQETIKRSWKALHKLGFAAAAVPAIEGKSKKAAAGEETDPDRMSWAEFCK
jgi:hypothetical protein